MRDPQGTPNDLTTQHFGVRDKAILWILLAGAGIIRMIAAIPSLPNGLFDDAYIGFRYSQNIAQGLGFVFNPGEKVLGTTAPLFILMLAAVSRVIGVSYLEWIAVAAGILSSLGILFSAKKSSPRAYLPPLNGVTSQSSRSCPPLISNSTSGMEPALFCS